MQAVVDTDSDSDSKPIKFTNRDTRSTKDVFGRLMSTTSKIPDAEAVFRARKARELARLGGGEEIKLKPLDDTQRYAKERSRLLREDDNDSEHSEVEDDLGGDGVRSFYSQRVHGHEDDEERREHRDRFLAHEQGGELSRCVPPCLFQTVTPPCTT